MVSKQGICYATNPALFSLLPDCCPNKASWNAWGNIYLVRLGWETGIGIASPAGRSVRHSFCGTPSWDGTHSNLILGAYTCQLRHMMSSEKKPCWTPSSEKKNLLTSWTSNFVIVRVKVVFEGFSVSTDHAKKNYKLFMSISLGCTEIVGVVPNLILPNFEIPVFKVCLKC